MESLGNLYSLLAPPSRTGLRARNSANFSQRLEIASCYLLSDHCILHFYPAKQVQKYNII